MNQQAMSSVDALRIWPGRRVVDVDALDLDRQLVALLLDFDVRLAEDHEQVAGAGVFQERFVAGADQEVGVHPRGQDGQLAVALGFLGDVRVEGEAADDQDVEADALDGFLGGFLHLLRADRAVLGTDRDGHADRLAVGAG